MKTPQNTTAFPVDAGMTKFLHRLSGLDTAELARVLPMLQVALTAYMAGRETRLSGQAT